MPRKPKKPSQSEPRAKRKGGTGKKRTASVKPKTTSALPSKTEILNFIANSKNAVGKREISRAFGIKGGARIALKRILAEMAEEGTLSGGRKELREKGTLPPVAVIEVTGTDPDGDLIAKPTLWNDDEGPQPTIRLLTTTAAERDRERSGNIGVGDKVLARITKLETPEDDGITHEAGAIKRLSREKRRLLGIFRAHAKSGGTIDPIDRKALRSWNVQKNDTANAKDGDLVRFDLARKGRFAHPQARIVEIVGNPDDQRQISLIAIHAHGLPDEFPQVVLDELKTIKPVDNSTREDLTDLPLITIDPADARDHDDAVYATPDTDPKNEGGFIVYVAIADVAHYVRPGSRLDREAQKRANSIYFPDRVVPMLPEQISNDLCSLREQEVRPCLIARMVFDKHGHKRAHKFLRAMMRSAIKLSYQEAQAAIDGNPSPRVEPVIETILKPLWAAYNALAKARDNRAPLDLNLPERRIILDKQGKVDRITTPERLDAHRLIEEFMIQANVAAAEALEAKSAKLIYRRHDSPSDEKLKSVRQFLETLDFKLPPGGSLRPAAFNRILARAKDTPNAELVNEVILRSQAQAEYHPENSGHFGLNLARYAHFTSPIRRYADLIVHRALITAHNLGDGGLPKDTGPALTEIAKHISETERRTMAAERETNDRLIATHLAGRIGATFNARIAGVTRSGLFVRLNETGADGFVPASTLGDDYYHYLEDDHALIGQRNNLAYRLGDRVEVRLVEAIPTAGALRFEMLTEGTKTRLRAPKGGHGRNTRGGYRSRSAPQGRRKRH